LPIQGKVEPEWAEAALHRTYQKPDSNQTLADFLDQDWVLLLQLDIDHDTGMMWGDAGRAYFGIPAEYLQARRFENAIMIWQCH
jgi:uncharacterized protein YwqG